MITRTYSFDVAKSPSRDDLAINAHEVNKLLGSGLVHERLSDFEDRIGIEDISISYKIQWGKKHVEITADRSEMLNKAEEIFSNISGVSELGRVA